MGWDTKYRPLKFRDVLGQEGSVAVLQAHLKNGSALSESYIFSGGSGQGKTTLARILAKALLCSNLGSDFEPCNSCDSCRAILADSSLAFQELDAASSGTIDNVRSIVASLPYAIPGAPKRIVLFDEAHRMSRDAQDVLLKPIEENRLICIFCTTEPHKIRPTIQGRCCSLGIRAATREEVADRMCAILDTEGVTYDRDAVFVLVDSSGGHIRDAINRSEMISQLGPVTLEATRSYLDLDHISVFYDVLISLAQADVGTAIRLTEASCDRIGSEDTSSGLAEAAMCSYRQSKGFYADFSYLDKEKAKQLYTLVGDTVLAFARRLVDAPRTKLGLVCELASLVSGSPVPSKVRVTTPLVLADAVSVEAPLPLAAPQLEAVPKAVAPSHKVEETKPVDLVKPPETSIKARPTQPPPSGPDPLSLGPFDDKVRGSHPRDNHRDRRQVNLPKVGETPVMLTIPETTRMILQTFKGFSS